MYAATAARDVVSLDVRTAYIASWRITTAGVPWIEGLTLPELDHPLRHVWVLEAANGHEVIGRSPGVVASGLPAFWLFGSDAPTNLPGALTAALMTALAVTLLFLALRTRLAQRNAVLCTFVFGFATPAWSVAANGLWPHTVTVLGICGLAWSSARERWWLAGLFGGVIAWGRLHAAVVVAAVGLILGVGRREPGITWRIGLLSLASLVPMIVWTRWMYGSWNPMASYDTAVFTGYAEENRFSVVNHLGFWISPDSGFLVWTPVILVMLPALVRSWRSLPEWARALTIGGLGYTVVQLTLNRFSGGDGFYGYRLGLELLACAAPAFAFASAALGPVARRLVGPVVALQAAAIFVGASRDSYFVASDRVWEDNAFVIALRENPVGGICVVAVSVLLGVIAQRIWAQSDSTERGTVSSHSVP
ncbi:hypothetical protein [Nocardioides bigeumensis]|uniref:hypothetical protein n=1 Tax=Nocardioides bigeumensis TaxID=433657 RepID=UPI0031D986E6